MRDLPCPFFKTEKKCLNLEKWYHRNKALKKIVLKSLGCLVVYTDFFIVKTIVKSVYYVFSGQFVTDKVINQYNQGPLDAKYIVYDDITETSDMQQQSDDAMNTNSKTTNEIMVIRCRISSFWNGFFLQEHIDNGSKEKQTKNQFCCSGFKDLLKRFYLSTIPLQTKIMQN